MTHKLTQACLLLLTLLFGGGTPSPSHMDDLQRQLTEFEHGGLAYRFLDGRTVQIYDEQTDFARIKTLQEPSTEEVYSWAGARGIPILEINPSLIDTMQFAGMYSYWTTIPISSPFGSSPMLVADVDNNRRGEIYAVFKDFTTQYTSQIYEVDSLGNTLFRYSYPRLFTVSKQVTDTNGDSLREVIFRYSDYSYNYRQPTIQSLPTDSNYSYRMWEAGGTSESGEFIGDLDRDTLADFLYRGSEYDSLGLTRVKTFVAEFNSRINAFQKVWSDSVPSGSRDIGWQGYAVGDFDGDGKMEFVASSIRGQVWVTENIGNDSYARTWQDSLPYVNMYYQTQGDVDGDGKPEFFVGATMSSGYWLTVFESDSENHYSPTFIFHILGAGTLDEPTNLTADIDGDGKSELVVLSGSALLVFKSDVNDHYYLWYYQRASSKVTMQVYDFNGDRKKELIVGKQAFSGGNSRLYSDIYRADFVTGVGEPKNTYPIHPTVSACYPNPFNPTTRMKIQLPVSADVTIAVHDVVGRNVKTLSMGKLTTGEHEVGISMGGLASGMYLIAVQAGQYRFVRKALLLK